MHAISHINNRPVIGFVSDSPDSGVVIVPDTGPDTYITWRVYYLTSGGNRVNGTPYAVSGHYALSWDKAVQDMVDRSS